MSSKLSGIINATMDYKGNIESFCDMFLFSVESVV